MPKLLVEKGLSIVDADNESRLDSGVAVRFADGSREQVNRGLGQGVGHLPLVRESG
jgi:hypothetical protein